MFNENSQATGTHRKPMTRFEQTFRLWLAGYGVSQEKADTLCANQRIAMSLRAQDPEGLYSDLYRTLHLLGPGPEEGEIRKVLGTTEEHLLFLIMFR